MSPVKRTKTPAEAAATTARKPRTAAKSVAAEPATPKKSPKAAAKPPVDPGPAAPAKTARKPKAEAPKAPVKRKTDTAAKPPAKPAAKPAPRVAAPLASALPPLAEALLKALQEGRAVELIFQDADANPPRTFEPRQLTFDTLAQAWFVWGWDRRYNAERHHRVEALAEVNAVEGVGRAAQGPFPEGTPSNQIGGWRGGEAIPVKAILLKQWIFAVKQAPPAFPDFTLADLEDGKAQVSFVGTDLRAIARWCMQFGDGLQVLEPQRLIDRIKQVGILWGGKPAPVAPPPPAPSPRPEPKPEPRRSEAKAKPEPRREREEPRREDSRREDSKREDSRREDSRREEPRREEARKPGRVEVRIERL